MMLKLDYGDAEKEIGDFFHETGMSKHQNWFTQVLVREIPV